MTQLFVGANWPSPSAPSLFDGTSAGLFRGQTAGRSLFGGRLSTTLFPSATESSRPISEDRSLFDGLGSPLEDHGITQDGLGHVYGFSSLWDTASRTYSWRWDEAYRRSRTDAIAMQRDAFMMSLLWERIFPTAQMAWHLEPGDKKDPGQKQVVQRLTELIDAIPEFHRLLIACLYALWYGRSGVQMVWDWEVVNGAKALIPKEHWPVSGDKVQFTWDGTPEIMVYPPIRQELNARGCETRYTDRGVVAVLSNPTWRDRFVIHKHDQWDADFYESDMSGGIHGVGLRGWCYWMWWIAKEVGSYMLDFLQRLGTGFTVYYYSAADPNAKAAAINIAKQQGRTTWIVWPQYPGETGAQKGVERIEPNVSGVAPLREIMAYFDDKIERLFIGQTMSSGADNESGLGGSGRAKFAKATKTHLITYDCLNLAGTLTRDFIRPLQKYNADPNNPAWRTPVRFKFDIEDDDPKEKMEAVVKATSVGVTFDEDDVRNLTGLPKPAADAKVVGGQQTMGEGGKPAQAEQGGQMFEGKVPTNGKAKSPSNLFGNVFAGKRGSPPMVQEEKHNPPVRYAALDTDSSVVAYVYPQTESPTVLGSLPAASMFVDWLRSHGGILERFANDGHTAPEGGLSDVNELRDALASSLAQIAPDDGPADASLQIRSIGEQLLMAVESVPDAEGVALSVKREPRPLERFGAPHHDRVAYAALDAVKEMARQKPSEPAAPTINLQLPDSFKVEAVLDSTAITSALQSDAEARREESARTLETMQQMGDALAEKMAAIADRDISVNVEAPSVSVAAPTVNVAAAPVNVPPANITVKAVLEQKPTKKTLTLSDGTQATVEEG